MLFPISISQGTRNIHISCTFCVLILDIMYIVFDPLGCVFKVDISAGISGKY